MLSRGAPNRLLVTGSLPGGTEGNFYSQEASREALFKWHVVGGTLRNRNPRAIPLENGPDRRRAPGRPCLSGTSGGGPYETAIQGQFR